MYKLGTNQGLSLDSMVIVLGSVDILLHCKWDQSRRRDCLFTQTYFVLWLLNHVFCLSTDQGGMVRNGYG